MYLPSIISLIPITGVSLIIYFSYKENFFIKILSSKIFLCIGRISYSLYLWHYPIFIIFPNHNFIFQIIFIFLFAIISYFLIEKKFRYNSINSFYSTQTIIFTNFFILTFMIIFLHLSKKIDYEKYPLILQNVLKENFSIEEDSTLDFNNNFVSNEKNNLYLTGDSHMAALLQQLKNDERTKKYNLINGNIGSGCGYIYNFHRVDLFTGKKFKQCTIADQKKRRENFLSRKDSIVVWGGRLPLWLNNSSDEKISRFFDKKSPHKSNHIFLNENNISLLDGIKNSIYDLLNNEIKVIIIYPVPVLEFDPIKK